ncbi:hypothetical protein [Leifsonia poae]|uniref:DUF222 domain-containing protein n=1 Tax=Leifsonia poae TaxID=110933 RepID=A0A9W6H602_9MICO|nr:hypothetical protein [Leifsonia poae]GLJ74601.1 hypothetical protein GCM10017584_01740 [Leifsonia poae]
MTTNPAASLRELALRELASRELALRELALRELASCITLLGELVATAGSVTPHPLPLPLSPDELLKAVTDLGDAQAVLDAVKVAVAGEVVRRSVVLDDDNPVMHTSHASPATLLAERWRLPLPAARQLCRVAEGVAPRQSILGEVLPAPFPVLAAAIAEPLAMPAAADRELTPLLLLLAAPLQAQCGA